ncbi:MAG: adenylate/guanylate cyclase domain-containing protein [Bacteroidota bacterium]
MNKLTVLLLAIFLVLTSFAQEQQLIDSLETEVRNINAAKIDPGKLTLKVNDTTEANTLFLLARSYIDINPQRAFDLSDQCRILSERIGYKKGMGNAYNCFGSLLVNKGDFMSAMEYYKAAFKIREEIGDKEGLAALYNNFGMIYYNSGNYPKALASYLTALEMNTASGNKQWQAYNLMNIGHIYSSSKNYSEAMKYYVASLSTSKEIGDVGGIALSYNHIGDVYKNQNNNAQALKYFVRCLKMKEEFGYKDLEALSYNNIGEVYKDQQKYPEALRNFFAALKISEEAGYKDGVGMSYNFIGIVYTLQKKYKEAKVYLQKGLLLSTEVGNIENIKDSYDALAKLAADEGDLGASLGYYKNYILYRDSMMNHENTRKITQQQMQFDFDAKESVRKSAQEKKDTLDRVVRNVLIGGLLTMLLFSVIFFIQRNSISKGKRESDRLLLNILPSEIAEELKKKGETVARQYNHVTVLFTDFVNFTGISEQMTPNELVAEIHRNFTAIDTIIEKHGLEKIKTIGDAYLAVSGLPNETPDHASRVAHAALDIREYMSIHKGKFEIRIGINSGPVVAGIVGVKKYAYDIWGDTVNTAARMEQNSEAGKINISASTYELIKNSFTCEYRGKIEAKNKGDMDMYFLMS